MRDTADIQFAPLPPTKPPSPPSPPPEWLQDLARALGKALEAVFGPLGRMLGMSWPAFQWVLIGLAGLLAAFLLWRVFQALAAYYRKRTAAAGDSEDLHWVPDRADAATLLEDAERLARQGRYDEAVHLLLRRSVRQIGLARPEWLVPASTAREISVLPMLPVAGRHAFATIAECVERSRYALRDLQLADWTAARAAYAEFARVELPA